MKLSPNRQRARDKVALDKVGFIFKAWEDDCGPSAKEITAKERERADQFKGNQLLPIMGIGGGSPSPPS